MGLPRSHLHNHSVSLTLSIILNRALFRLMLVLGIETETSKCQAQVFL